MDTSEISGKNKMMFMVTVSGTAVKAQRLLADATAAPETQHDAGVTVADLDAEDLRLRLCELSKTSDLDSEEVFRDVVACRVDGLSPLVLEWVREADGDIGLPSREVRLDRAVAFFGNLDRDTASESLYANAVVPSSPARMCEKQILERLHLVDYERTAALLESPARDQYWWGLQTLAAKKASYSVTDVALVDRCINAIKGRPSSEAELVTVKKLMGKKQVWRCLDGHENEAEADRCYCGWDRGGFRRRDVTTEAALRSLARLRLVLGKCLGE